MTADGLKETVFELSPFRYDNLQAFIALCGLMRILSETKPEWNPVCRWAKTDDTRGFRLKIKLSGSVDKEDFAGAVDKGVRENLAKMKENWINTPPKTGGTVTPPLTCDYGNDIKKSPFWMANVKPKETAKKSFNTLTKEHVRDSLFKRWDYGEKSAETKRKGDKRKKALVGNFCWDPIYSSRKHYKLGYPPNEESPPVEAGANALAGCGWEAFPCVPQAKKTVAPCYHKERNRADTVCYPVWDVWLGFEEIKSLLWSNYKIQQLPKMGIIAVVSVEIQIGKNGGKRALQGKIIKEF